MERLTKVIGTNPEFSEREDLVIIEAALKIMSTDFKTTSLLPYAAERAKQIFEEMRDARRREIDEANNKFLDDTMKWMINFKRDQEEN